MSQSSKKWNPISYHISPRLKSKMRKETKKYGFYSPNFIFSTSVLIIFFLVFLIPNLVGFEGFFGRGSSVDLIAYNVNGESIQIDGSIGVDEYSQSYSDSDNGFVIHASHNATHLFIGEECDGDGWCAIGFNDKDTTSSMAGADIKLGWVDESGATFTKDLYATGYARPMEDDSPNSINTIAKFSGTQITGKTTIEFAISLNTGDNNDRILQVGSVYRLIYARGAEDAFNIHIAKSYLSFEISSETA